MAKTHSGSASGLSGPVFDKTTGQVSGATVIDYTSSDADGGLWRAKPNLDDQWVELDLTQPVYLDRIELTNDGCKEIALQLSADRNVWTEVATETLNDTTDIQTVTATSLTVTSIDTSTAPVAAKRIDCYDFSTFMVDGTFEKNVRFTGLVTTTEATGFIPSKVVFSCNSYRLETVSSEP